ncbi:SDR family NAD(P)-dependent oxidoreductase [Erythrobacter crassostreae]|uniref:SDR family oxidoreductase n=1 Tax=Erythrobacter crassostreae TaxID=2828328 RepID=A0A9X1F240_9SPHN|nr:SDR family oxidoreductase [Erythrobacter crassostrea]MBV7258662.1 SDR family oxidoreductase [Erythrobacter crassostrea]
MNGLFDLQGHVALVTGGNTGLGLGMARGLAKAGASVAIWGRNSDRNTAAAKELASLGVEAQGFVCDVTDPAAINAAMEATVDRFGRLDSCFANAGGSGVRKPFVNHTPADWQSTIDLNFNSVTATMQAAAKQFISQGSGGKLIVSSSIAALMGIPGGGYSATKAAVSGLIRSLAIELAPANIQANAILPGFIETDMSVQTPQAFQDACLRRTASGKLGNLEDMEGIAVFLASQQSNLVTGHSLVIDGGQSIFPM